MHKIEEEAILFAAKTRGGRGEKFGFMYGALWMYEQALELAHRPGNGMATEEIAFVEKLGEFFRDPEE